MSTLPEALDHSTSASAPLRTPMPSTRATFPLAMEYSEPGLGALARGVPVNAIAPQTIADRPA